MEPKRKRVRKGEESYTGDPKPGDLTMSRVKRAEYVRGGPNPGLLQKAGMTCGKR